MNRSGEIAKYAAGPQRRILLGTNDIAGQLLDLADGFRQLGQRVTSVVNTRNPFYPHHQYDVALDSDPIDWGRAAKKASGYAPRPIRNGLNRSARLGRLVRLIARHDVFVFLWGGESLRWGTEIPFLKRLGKKVVWIFCGDDVRHSSAFFQEFSSIVLSANHSERLTEDELTRPLESIRLAELYCDLIISQPNQSGLAVRPYNHFFVPINLSPFKSRIPGRDIPVIVHAPSVKSVKGTDHILQTLERLKFDGLQFELRLLEGISNKQVLAELQDADVVVDQLHFPLHGKLGVEAMASGCALATCNREDYEPIPPNRPIWHVEPYNLYERLRELLSDRALRIRLAKEGRTYVEKYHDHVEVVKRIIRAWDGDVEYDHYPTFFACKYELPERTVIPDRLKRMTSKIVQRWGLPEGIDPDAMIRRGLMSPLGLSSPIPRWTVTQRTTALSRTPVLR